MKTIDTKSLFLGATLSVLVLILTSSKTASDNNNDLEIFARNTATEVFNKKTNIIYEYYSNSKGKINDKPDNIYKIADDGSSIIINK